MLTDLQAAQILSIVCIVNQMLTFSSSKHTTDGLSYLQCIYAISILAKKEHSFATNLHYAFAASTNFFQTAGNAQYYINFFLLVGMIFLLSGLLFYAWALQRYNRDQLGAETICKILYGQNLMIALTKICDLPVFMLSIYLIVFNQTEVLTIFAVAAGLSLFFLISVMSNLMPKVYNNFPQNIHAHCRYLYTNNVLFERIQIAVKIIMSLIVVISTYLHLYELNYIIVGVEALKLLIVFKLDQYQFGRALTLIRIILLALFGLVLAFLDSRQWSKFLTLSIVLVEVLFTICICSKKTYEGCAQPPLQIEVNNHQIPINNTFNNNLKMSMAEIEVEVKGDSVEIEMKEEINYNQKGFQMQMAEIAANKSLQHYQPHNVTQQIIHMKPLDVQQF